MALAGAEGLWGAGGHQARSAGAPGLQPALAALGEQEAAFVALQPPRASESSEDKHLQAGLGAGPAERGVGKSKGWFPSAQPSLTFTATNKLPRCSGPAGPITSAAARAVFALGELGG